VFFFFFFSMEFNFYSHFNNLINWINFSTKYFVKVAF